MIWKGKVRSYFLRRDLGFFVFIFLLKIEMMIKFGVKIKGLGTISIDQYTYTVSLIQYLAKANL